MRLFLDPEQWVRLGRLLNLGIQLAVTVAAFGVLGWWLDQTFDTAPVLVVLCAIVGVVVAMIYFFREVLQLKDENKKSQS